MLLLTRLSNGLLGVSLLYDSLVATRVDELVVDDLDGGVVGGEEGDLVGDAERVGESRDILSGTSKAENDVLAVGTTQLSLALLTDDGQIGLGSLS